VNDTQLYKTYGQFTLMKPMQLNSTQILSQASGQY